MCHHVNLPLSVLALVYQQHQDRPVQLCVLLPVVYPDPVNKDWDDPTEMHYDHKLLSLMQRAAT